MIKEALMKSYHADEDGFYGPFGGAFIPEMLYPNVAELKSNYLHIMESPEFQKDFRELCFYGLSTSIL
jgi:tryptophan synthase beta chain